MIFHLSTKLWVWRGSVVFKLKFSLKDFCVLYIISLKFLTKNVWDTQLIQPSSYDVATRLLLKLVLCQYLIQQTIWDALILVLLGSIEFIYRDFLAIYSLDKKVRFFSFPFFFFSFFSFCLFVSLFEILHSNKIWFSQHSFLSWHGLDWF